VLEMVLEVAPQIGEVTVGDPLVNALAFLANEHVVYGSRR
jgi:hypothetical protein